MQFDMDAEEFMTALRDDITRAREVRPKTKLEKLQLSALRRSLGTAYTQTLFVFAHILNEICNGPESTDYRDLVGRAAADARYITFNWDTLLDRVLGSEFGWSPDSGYDVQFESVMDDGWRATRSKPKFARLLKLHGSTNWIVRWVSFDNRGERRMLVKDPSVHNLSLHTEAFFKGEKLDDVGAVSELEKVEYRTTLDELNTHTSAVAVSDHLVRPYLF
ncbi:MAG TPA: hypothetical protein VGO08_24370, partial [Burkholderiales bacterium]|nr:hypothetical protein [Burkholderiales bacterium]